MVLFGTFERPPPFHLRFSQDVEEGIPTPNINIINKYLMTYLST
jgi:hypothetical protein